MLNVPDFNMMAKLQSLQSGALCLTMSLDRASDQHHMTAAAVRASPAYRAVTLQGVD